MHVDVAIIGAGLAGLTAAWELRASGLTVAVVDKGRGVGGRLATHRIGDARLDHGAQFFTVRGQKFRTVVDEAIGDGVVEVWCHGFSSDDGYPRYRGAGGMTSLAKWLAARLKEDGVSITLSSRVVDLSPTDDRWTMIDEDERSLSATHAIITAPVPQSLELFATSGLVLDSTHNETLSEIEYKPVLGLLVTLDGPSSVPPPGAIQATEEDLFTFIADNQTKGISPLPALTLHTNGVFSAARYEDLDDDVIAELLPAAREWFGDSTPLEVQLKRWRYAGPINPYPQHYLTTFTEPGLIVLAGDAFGGPKVEGAFNSGVAAAAAITSSAEQ